MDPYFYNEIITLLWKIWKNHTETNSGDKRDGIFNGFMGIYEEAKKILASSTYYHPASFRITDCSYKQFSNCTVYLYTFLGLRRKI